MRQAGKASSFKDASDDLLELACVSISPNHLSKIAERIGKEWQTFRDRDVQAFRENQLKPQYAEPPKVACAMVDGGRAQTRDEDSGNGVSGQAWQEVKVACCQSMSSVVSAIDPQPEPPSKFLDRIEVARLTAEIKSRGGKAVARAEKKAPKQQKKQKKSKRPEKRVRTVVASMSSSEEFGWHMAAEVQRRGLGSAERKGYICDGLKYNWTLYEMHLQPQGFIAILDFLHLLAYLYTAAMAVEGKGTVQAWTCYERWLRQAWSGQVKELLVGLKEGCGKLGAVPEGCSEDDPRKVAADALGYVTNNQKRMDYARYRKLGLPISSAAVESVMKQMNKRMKGTEKFWLEGGAEAMVQIRAAYLSEDGRADRYWALPRPYSPAVGSGRFQRKS